MSQRPAHATHNLHNSQNAHSGNKASRVSQGVTRAFTWNRTPPPPPPGPSLSEFSTYAVPDSGWCSKDFMFGAAMVIIQDNTHKVVVVHDKHKSGWFFPRGRKDVGESLEQAALREGFEESGYRVELMPHWASHHAPDPHNRRYTLPTCEPIFVTTIYWPPKYRNINGKLEKVDEGGEYIITWYLGRIGEDAVCETGTGMPDEAGYEASLLTYEEAYKLVPPGERGVLVYAWQVYKGTIEYNAQLAAHAEARTSVEMATVSALPTLDTQDHSATNGEQQGEAAGREPHL